MVRASQQWHPPFQAAPLRPAATVLLLRDSPQGGLEVLMTRRSEHARFAPGAYVFPGGTLDADDAAVAAWARPRPGQDAEAVHTALAAIRECFEELGVLLAFGADGQWACAAQLQALDRAAPLWPQCQALGLRPAVASLHLLARWITDRDLPRRFDVPFLVAPMPPGQTPVADGQEQFAPEWVSPSDALRRHEAGQFFMVYPTVRTLERLQGYACAQAVIEACSVDETPLWVSCPRAGWLGGKEARYMEHEAPFGELELTCPDGQIAHALDWQSDHPVMLLRHVQRLTAPNPGFMTGPGTNSYLVGDPTTGYVAIDPGPADPAHLERLWHAAGGDLRAIVCTHSHPDHSPGAAPLQQRCLASQGTLPPILGLPSAATARANSQFCPDQTLQDGQAWVLRNASGTVTHTLRVWHTPGHAANHLCLVLEEDGLLFSGDHILNGSTTVIDPPDGNMDAYLASLDRLSLACEAHDIRFILPAHGYVLGSAPAAIARLKAHRLQREAKVAAAMRELPAGTPDDWLKQAYNDVPERLWPVAKRSLLAHVERLQSLGLFNHA
jgi:recombination protein RecT